MNSKTVQAAQRLEISGTLVAMGGEVPRLEIECDNGRTIVVGNLPAAMLSEMPMLLYKRVRLTVEAESQPAPVTDFNLYTSPLSAPGAAPEDAERAAYLERWKDAPEWAQWLSESVYGVCFWHDAEPKLIGSVWTYCGTVMQTAHDLLGSVKCEPRPRQGEGS